MIVYFYDKATRKLTGAGYLDDGSALPENATTVEPIGVDGQMLYEPVFNGVDKWTGTSQAEYEQKYSDTTPTKADDLSKVVSDALLQITKLNLEVQRLTKEVGSNKEA